MVGAPKIRGRRTRAEQRAATLKLILDTAEDLFAQLGYFGVTIKDVANGMGIHPALIHYYFDGKKELFDSVFERRMEYAITNRTAGLDAYEAEVGDHPTVEGALRAYYDGAFDVYINDDEGWRKFGRIFAKVNNAPGYGTEKMAVYFDPLVQGAFRSSLLNALKQMLLAMEMEIKARVLAESLPAQLQQTLSALTGRMPIDSAAIPKLQLHPGWGSRRLMDVVAEQSRLKKLPTSVQQNVAAWSVFGIFFIVLPLGGAIIGERKDGTLARLRTLPVPYITLLVGKLGAYVTVCWVQFLFIVLMGKTGLPLLGAPVLSLGSDTTALIVTVTMVALAACGYGLMLGTLARTLEQATMFGAVSVVCAAALGGIMVPVYVMPPVMQTISLFSPLAWGLNALVEIAVREGTLGSVRHELLYLAAFFAATMAIAWTRIERFDR